MPRKKKCCLPSFAQEEKEARAAEIREALVRFAPALSDGITGI